MRILRSIFIITFLLTSSLWCKFVESRQHYPHKSEYLGNPILEDEDSLLSAKIVIKRQETGEHDDSEKGSGQEQSPTPSPSPTPPEEQNLTSAPPFTSPPPSKSPTTESTTTITSTAEPSTSTTTEMPFVIPNQGKATKGYFCLCDFQVRKCDMNCCCDLDCTEEEKSLFTGCTDSLIYDPKNRQNKDHSCVKSYVMYRENVPYRVERTSKGLLCVAKENLKQEKEFNQKDMARIIKRITHGRLDTRPKYKWDDTVKEDNFIRSSHQEPYKYGSAILTATAVEGDDSSDNYQEDLFRLPASFQSEICSINEPVKFLLDFTETCTLPLIDLRDQCESVKELNANNFVKNFMVIANPDIRKINVTHGDGYVLKDVISSKVCRNNWTTCDDLVHEVVTENDESGDDSPDPESEDFPIPELTVDKTKCNNIMTNLNLTFIHNGTKGIIQIRADVLLVNASIDEEKITQQFSVKFVWVESHKIKHVGGSNKTNENSTTTNEDILALKKLPRSGNPGYLVGKPVILGRKVVATSPPKNDSSSTTNTVIEKIHVLPDSSQWLHIHAAGDCPVDLSELQNSQSHPVLFGYEHISSCKLSLELFSTCQQLQRHIISILLGDENPENIVNSPPFVAAYGSPDAFPSDWVPLTFTEKSTFLPGTRFSPSAFLSASNPITRGCEGIMTSLHITIAHAYVGPVDSPQAKITGVFFEPEEPIQLNAVAVAATEEEKENPPLREIVITTTVSFVDVTEKPTTRVATWPILSIQLPEDFFYPFSSSSSNTASPSSAGEKNRKVNFSTSFGIILLFLGVFVVG